MDAPSPRALLAHLILLSVLGTAALGLIGAFLITGNELLERIGCAVLAVTLTYLAGYRFFVVAARSRRPQRQRAYALVALVAAAYLVVLAFSGV